MPAPKQQRPDIDAEQQRVDRLDGALDGTVGESADAHATYIDSVNKAQARIRQLRTHLATLKDAKKDGWQELEKTVDDEERKLHDALRAVTRPEDVRKAKETIEARVAQMFDRLDAAHPESAADAHDARATLEKHADAFHRASAAVLVVQRDIQEATAALAADAKDYKGQWFQDKTSEGIIRQRVDRIGRLQKRLEEARTALGKAAAEYVAAEIAVLKADAQAAFDRGDTDVGNRTLLKIWEKHGANLNLKEMDAELWGRMGSAIGDLKRNGKLSAFEEKFFGNDASYDDTLKTAVDEHQSFEKQAATDVDVVDQLKSGGSVTYENYALPERTRYYTSIYGGYRTITTQNGETIRGVGFDNAALAIIDKNPKGVVFLKKPFSIQLSSQGAIERASYVDAKDLAYGRLEDDGKTLVITDPTSGKVIRRSDVGALEKGRDERVNDVLRCVDRDPAVAKILGNASDVHRGCQTVQSLFAGGSEGGKYEQFVEFSRNGANELSTILNDPTTVRNALAARSKLQELKRAEMGIAHSALEAELDARIKALDGFIDTIRNPQLRAAIDTMRDKSKWSADTWANWVKKEGPQILVAIALAVAATAAVILTCGGASPLALAMMSAAAGTAGGMAGAELTKEIQHAVAQYDADIAAGKATYTERSKIGAYVEGQKVRGADGVERSMDFLGDVVSPYAQEFAVGFITTLGTMGAANVAGGTISRFLQNPRVLAALSKHGPTLNKIILRMQRLEQARTEATQKTIRAFAAKVTEQFGDELKDEALENAADRFLTTLQTSLGQAERGLGWGDAAAFLVGTVQNVRLRKPGVMTYRANPGIPHSTVATELKASLERGGYAVSVDAANPAVLFASRGTEIFRVEPDAAEKPAETEPGKTQADVQAEQPQPIPVETKNGQSQEPTPAELTTIARTNAPKKGPPPPPPQPRGPRPKREIDMSPDLSNASKFNREMSEAYNKSLAIVLGDGDFEHKRQEVRKIIDACDPRLRPHFQKAMDAVIDGMMKSQQRIETEVPKGKEAEYFLTKIARDLGGASGEVLADLEKDIPAHATFVQGIPGVCIIEADQFLYDKLKACGALRPNTGAAVFAGEGEISFIVLPAPKSQNGAESRAKESLARHETHHMLWLFMEQAGVLKPIEERDDDFRRGFRYFRDEMIAYTIESNDITSLGAGAYSLTYADNPEVLATAQRTTELVILLSKIAKEQGVHPTTFLPIFMNATSFDDLARKAANLVKVETPLSTQMLDALLPNQALLEQFLQLKNIRISPADLRAYFATPSSLPANQKQYIEARCKRMGMLDESVLPITGKDVHPAIESTQTQSQAVDLAKAKDVAGLKAYLKANDVDDATRIELANALLGVTLEGPARDAVIAAHNLPGEIDALSQAELRAKTEALAAGVTDPEQRRLLIESGICGNGNWLENAVNPDRPRGPTPLAERLRSPDGRVIVKRSSGTFEEWKVKGENADGTYRLDSQNGSNDYRNQHVETIASDEQRFAILESAVAGARNPNGYYATLRSDGTLETDWMLETGSLQDPKGKEPTIVLYRVAESPRTGQEAMLIPPGKGPNIERRRVTLRELKRDREMANTPPTPVQEEFGVRTARLAKPDGSIDEGWEPIRRLPVVMIERGGKRFSVFAEDVQEQLNAGGKVVGTDQVVEMTKGTIRTVMPLTEFYRVNPTLKHPLENPPWPATTYKSGSDVTIEENGKRIRAVILINNAGAIRAVPNDDGPMRSIEVTAEELRRWNTPSSRTRRAVFSIGEEVYVRRSNGVVERGWVIRRNDAGELETYHPTEGTKPFRPESMFHINELEQANALPGMLNLDEGARAVQKKHDVLRKMDGEAMTAEEYHRYFDGEFAQGNLGNCFLVAALYSLKQSPHAEAMICTSVKKVNGGWSVGIPLGTSLDSQQRIFVPDAVVAERRTQQATRIDKKTGKPYVTNLSPMNGPLGWRVIEAAYVMHANGGVFDLAALDNGGHADMALLDLCGKGVDRNRILNERDGTYRRNSTFGESDPAVRERVIAWLDSFSNGRDIGMVSTKSSGLDDTVQYAVDGILLYEKHAYSVKSVDKFQKTVTVVNPHSTSVEIIMTYDQFIRSFNCITSAQFDYENMFRGMTQVMRPVRPSN